MATKKKSPCKAKAPMCKKPTEAKKKPKKGGC